MKIKKNKWVMALAVLLAAVMLLAALAALTPQKKRDYDVGFDWHDYYVRDGLTVLYEAYADNSDVAEGLSKGLWYGYQLNGNGELVQVRDASAMLAGGAFSAANPTGWKYDVKNGGLSYDMTYEQYKAENGQSANGVRFDTALLDGEYTVDSVLLFKGLTNADGTKYIDTTSTYGVYNKYNDAFAFGPFRCMAVVAEHLTNTHGTRSLRWFYSNASYDRHQNVLDNFSGDVYGTYFSDKDNYFKRVTDPSSMAVVHRVSADATTENFTIYYNNQTNKSYDTSLSSQINAHPDGLLTAQMNGMRFQILNGAPGTIYAVRVYDRALTYNELAQNHFVDMMLYHGIEFDEFLDLNDESRLALYGAFEGVTFGTSKNAVLDLIEQTVGD